MSVRSFRLTTLVRVVAIGGTLVALLAWLAPATAYAQQPRETDREIPSANAGANANANANTNTNTNTNTNAGSGVAQPARPVPPAEPVVGPPSPTTPGSLWIGGTGYIDLVSDLRAREVGDLVTIRIVESTRASQSAETDTSRDASVSGGIDNLFGLENYVPDDINLAALIAGNTSRSFSGGGENSRTNSLTTTLTARVMEVLPNRNLVVEATRLVRVNNEEESITLRGTLRPYDISATNVALSTALGDVQILYGGKGVIGGNLKPGFLMRLVQFIF
jgi:flagellar L-ring protein precursor FlgH